MERIVFLIYIDIPQIGIAILNELNIFSGSLLDPYCGSGSSFASGLACGLKEFTGFDLNPLAIAIVRVRFSKVDLKLLRKIVNEVKQQAYSSAASGLQSMEINKFGNFDYWFSERIAKELQLLKNIINVINNFKIKNFLLLALSSTIRDCSYVRNNEFKLYRMKEKSLSIFNPDVLCIFFNTLQKMIGIYTEHYHSALEGIHLNFERRAFRKQSKFYDIVLTSPPYGDSKTTVAYGQFSMFANSCAFSVDNARALDSDLMGGKIAKKIFKLNSVIDN